MPILAVDSMGRIYQTSPDREDGLGFGSAPECVDQQDLTLGAAYLKSQDRQREENLRRYRQNQILDANDRAHQKREQMVREAKARKAQAEARMYENPAMVSAITRKAYEQSMSGMGCACEYSTPVDGNVMSATGMNGWAGKSRDQQAIHNAVLGIGQDVAHRIDPVEAEQMRHKMEAERILRLKARR